RPRDPARIAAHATFGPSLIESASGAVGDDAFERATAGSPVMAEVRREALRSWLKRANERALPDTDSVVDDVVDLSVQRLRDEPEIWEGLVALDVARSLAASWRGGLVAELGWPAFDEAVEELGTEELQVHGPWPYTVLFNARKAIVLGPDGARLTTLDLRLPKGTDPVGVRWIGGQLLVGWRESGSGKAAWSGSWRQPFAAEIPYWDRGENRIADLADGTCFLGVRPFAVGEHAWPGDEDFLHDGERFWRRSGGRFLPLDPRTGKTMEGGPPSFFADIDPDELDTADLRYVPGRGPWAIRRVGERTETLDGLVFEGDAQVDLLVVLPGDTAARGVVESWRDLTIHAPEGYATDEREEDDEHPMPPLDRWHWFTPRDPTGSAVLRGADTALARAVMEALRSAKDPNAALAEALPAVTDPRLRQGVSASVVRALGVERKLRDFLEERGEAPTVEPGGATASSIALALGLAGPDRGYWDADHDPIASLEADAAFLAGGEGPPGAMDLDWPAFGRRLRAAGFALARPGLSEQEREHVLAFLRAWVELPDLRVRRATWSFADLTSPFLKTEIDDGERHLVERWSVADGGRWIASTDDTWSDEGPFDVTTVSVGDATPPAATPQGTTTEVDTAAHRDWIRSLIEAAERNGVNDALAEGAADALAERTGLSRAAAVLLLAAAPRLDSWQSDFLGTELREGLGLKKKEADLGRSELTRLGLPKLAEVLVAAAPDDPDRLWSGAIVDEVASAFLARFGRRLPIPPELRAAAKKALGDDDALDWVAAPDGVELLTTDGSTSLDDDGDVVAAEGKQLTLTEVGAVQELLPWLMQQLPIGDPLLGNALLLARRLEERLANPELLFEAGYGWASSAKKAKSLFDAMGGELQARTGSEGWSRRDLGGLLVMHDDETVKAVVRPTRFDEDHQRLLLQIADALDDDDLRHSAHVMALLRGGRLRATLDRLEAPLSSEGGQACDPRASVPDVVAQARQELGLSEAAACLFLQLLALLTPTKKAVQAWNGWSAKAFAAAASELVDAELVIEAKRARAGRDHFLPGPWVDGPIPWEQWKAPLLDAREKKNQVTLPRSRAVVFDPPHVLFREAWRRYASGDRPRFR
ncbi:MAG: hypothetical protein KC621_33730, partial [Myxococcales bacterium]|nr:hypothetical protein [Myxococcales bacterium]